MKYDTSEVDELISWSEEDDFNANNAPSKWVHCWRAGAQTAPRICE
jgi:hypothetical protein